MERSYAVINQSKIDTKCYWNSELDNALMYYLNLLENNINLIKSSGAASINDMCENIFIIEQQMYGDQQHVVARYKYNINLGVLTKNTIGTDDPYFGNDISEHSKCFMYRLHKGIYMDHNIQNQLAQPQFVSKSVPLAQPQFVSKPVPLAQPINNAPKQSLSDILNSTANALDKINLHSQTTKLVPTVIDTSESCSVCDDNTSDDNNSSSYVDSCSIDINTSEINDDDINKVRLTLENLKCLKNNKNKNLHSLKNVVKHDEKNYVEYKYNINCDEHELRKNKEKNDNEMRVFLSDRDFTYKKMKEEIENEEVCEANIPGMFVGKYPIFKYMDNNNLLNNSDAFDIYKDLHSRLHGNSESDSESDKASEYIPHNVHYLDEQTQTKYDTKIKNQQNDGIFMKQKKIESFDSIMEKLDVMEKLDHTNHSDNTNHSSNTNSDTENDTKSVTNGNTSEQMQILEQLINSFEDSTELTDTYSETDSEIESESELQKLINKSSNSSPKSPESKDQNNKNLDKLASALNNIN